MQGFFSQNITPIVLAIIALFTVGIVLTIRYRRKSKTISSSGDTSSISQKDSKINSDNIEVGGDLLEAGGDAIKAGRDVKKQ